MGDDAVRRSDLQVVISVASTTEVLQRIFADGVDESRIAALRITARPRGELVGPRAGADEVVYFALEVQQAEGLIETLTHALDHLRRP